jgi:hypothetical protein
MPLSTFQTGFIIFTEMIGMIYRAGFPFFFLISFILLSRTDALCQDINNGKFSTQATDPDARPDACKMGPKEKNYLFIIKDNPEGTLYGNPCFKDVSHKFGFEYLVAPKGVVPNSNGFSRNLHNFGVNIVLFFRNGPFWKARMKKKFEQCKYGYGDYVG